MVVCAPPDSLLAHRFISYHIASRLSAGGSWVSAVGSLGAQRLDRLLAVRRGHLSDFHARVRGARRFHRIAGLPLVVKPIQTALEGRQLKAIEFAGAVHGASGWTILRHITLPYVRPQILSGLLLGVSRASGEVGITMMVGGNLSGKTNTLSLEIFNAVSRADFDAAAALCLILSIFTIVIFAILEGIRRRTPAE